MTRSQVESVGVDWGAAGGLAKLITELAPGRRGDLGAAVGDVGPPSAVRVWGCTPEAGSL